MTTEPSITCPVCGTTSYNARDVEEEYCGNCHAWTGRPTNQRPTNQLIQLPLLTREELEVLYEAIDEVMARMPQPTTQTDALAGTWSMHASHRWGVLNSLRTAVGEAKAQPWMRR